MTIDFDTMRERIAENVLAYERTSLGIGSYGIFYNDDMGEYVMISDIGDQRIASCWDDLETHLSKVPDEDIQDWYEENAAQDYEEEVED